MEVDANVFGNGSIGSLRLGQNRGDEAFGQHGDDLAWLVCIPRGGTSRMLLIAGTVHCGLSWNRSRRAHSCLLDLDDVQWVDAMRCDASPSPKPLQGGIGEVLGMGGGVERW